MVALQRQIGARELAWPSLRVEVNTVDAFQGRESEHLSSQYKFFHWHLAFPEVFAKGGFDCVLGKVTRRLNMRWV